MVPAQVAAEATGGEPDPHYQRVGDIDHEQKGEDSGWLSCDVRADLVERPTKREVIGASTRRLRLDREVAGLPSVDEAFGVLRVARKIDRLLEAVVRPIFRPWRCDAEAVTEGAEPGPECLALSESGAVPTGGELLNSSNGLCKAM